jgi:phosphate-selective porin OprO/OprP
MSYEIDLGVNPDGFFIEDTYVKLFQNVDYLGTLKIGQYRTPYSLNAYTSSRDIRFMEPAAPVTALAPGVNAGLQIGRSALQDRMTWILGVFAEGAGTDSGDSSKNYGRAIFRITGLPIAQGNPKEPSSQRLLHLGMNASWLYSSTSTVRYRTRPESHLASYLLDTGDLDADETAALDFEAAYIRGPLSLQGEFLANQIMNSEGDTLRFGGFYAQVGWFLTGESRPYNRQEGRFSPIVPLRDLRWLGGDGWGAWEVVGRFSYTDLSDGPVTGGRMALSTLGLNWNLNSHMRMTANYIFGDVDGEIADGRVNIFQLRLEIGI